MKNKQVRSIRLPEKEWKDLKELGESNKPPLSRWQMICKLISDRMKRAKVD